MSGSTERQGEVSRHGGCELLFGEGAVKDTLDGKLFGVETWAARGLEDERDKVDVWIPVKFGLLSSLGHVTWAGARCCNGSWAAGEKGDTMARGTSWNHCD